MTYIPIAQRIRPRCLHPNFEFVGGVDGVAFEIETKTTLEAIPATV